MSQERGKHERPSGNVCLRAGAGAHGGGRLVAVMSALEFKRLPEVARTRKQLADSLRASHRLSGPMTRLAHRRLKAAKREFIEQFWADAFEQSLRRPLGPFE
jgi:hypothetical protein